MSSIGVKVDALTKVLQEPTAAQFFDANQDSISEVDVLKVRLTGDPTAATTINPMTGFTWSLKQCFRPFELMDKNFVQFKEGFERANIVTDITTSACTTTVSNGCLVGTFSGNGSFYYRQYNTGPKVPFFTVKAGIAEMSGDATLDNVGVGIQKDSSNQIIYYYDNVSKNIKVSIIIAGVANTGTLASIDIAGKFDLIVSVTEMGSNVFIDRGNGPELIGLFNIAPYYDTRTIGNLVGWKYVVYGGAGSTGKTILISSFEAGYFGTTAIANQMPVTYEDGTPIMEGNSMYFCATSGGVDSAGSNSYNILYTSIYKINMMSGALESVAKIFTNRSGKYTGDIAGNILFDREEGIWRVFLQNTGDFGASPPVMIQWKSKVSLLSGMHILENGVETELTTNYGYWDSYTIKVDGIWYCAYSDKETSGSQPKAAMVTSASADGPWAALWLDSSTTNLVEGGRIVKIGNTFYAVFKELGIRFIGYELDGTFIGANTSFAGGLHNFSHPTIIPVPEGTNKTRFVLHTFGNNLFNAGSQNYGELLMYEAAETLSGFGFLVSGYVPRP